MTTIAWRGDVMAGDSAIWVENTLVYKTKKIHRLKDGSICGYCGAVDEALAIIRHFDGDETEKVKWDEVTILMLKPNGQLLKYDKQVPTKLKKIEYLAIGTGQSVALGAMYQGATAIEAVQAAIEHDSHTRGPVTWMKV